LACSEKGILGFLQKSGFPLAKERLPLKHRSCPYGLEPKNISFALSGLGGNGRDNHDAAIVQPHGGNSVVKRGIHNPKTRKFSTLLTKTGCSHSGFTGVF
jgi:hypothetical protein